MLNNRAIIDTRKVLSGKDGGLFSLDGTLLASCETYQAQVNVTNAKYQPLGDAQEHEVFTGFGVTLNFTEIVVEDEQFLKELVEAMQRGEMPIWNFQGVLKGRNGTEERMHHRPPERHSWRRNQAGVEYVRERAARASVPPHRITR